MVFDSPEDIDGSVEETAKFAPKFGADGLLPAIATQAGTGRVLMLAYMNAEALKKTLETGQAWYWSRSRRRLWRKGESSGNVQNVKAVRVDCDQDALEIVVEQTGPACHTGRQSCFYRTATKDPSAPSGYSLK